MIRLTRKLIYIAVIAVAAVAMAFGVYACQNTDKKKIVVIFSQHSGLHCYEDFRESLEKALRKERINAHLSYFYLDCEKWNHNEEVDEARRILNEAGKNGFPDMVMTIGDEVTYSVMTTQDSMIRTVPVVFGAVAFPNEGMLRKNPNLVGFKDSTNIVENIYLAGRLCGIHAVNTLLSSHYLDKMCKKRIKEQIAGRTDILDNIGWEHTLFEIFSMPPEMYSITPFSLYNLQQNTHMDTKQDSLGNENLMLAMSRFSKMTYVQMKYDQESQMMVNMSSTKPMLTATWLDFGAQGSRFIAGYFAGAETIANDVAGVAAEIFKGKKTTDIPVRIHKKDYWMDWLVAKKHGYTKDNLPEDFKIINMTWRDKHPKLYLVINYGSGIIAVIVILVLLRILYKERKQKRKALKQVERENMLYNMAVENSHTFAWERYGETIYLSDTFWHHYGHEPHVCDVDEFVGMIHPDYRKEFLSGVDKVNRGDSYSGEVKADFYRNGEWHWYQIRGKGVVDAKGKYKRSYGMLLKVDDYKLKEFQLDEARRLAEEATLKESFLANMSHEIRTPLNAIVGFSQLLAMPGEEYSPEEKAMFIDAILTNNDLLLKLVNDIVDLSCVESGEMKFVIKTHSARAIVTRAYNKYKDTVPDNLDFRLTMPEDDSDENVDVDESRLDIIFKNLIANAVKYTKDGSISIGWQRATGRYDVEIYVEDTGCGLADNDAKMVFNRFYKKDKFQQGTGLGLSICKAVAIRLDGDIKVKSKIGEGTRFSVYLN